MPESFKVLIKELQSIGLDVKVLTEDEEEIPIRDTEDDIHETARALDLGLGNDLPAEAPSRSHVLEPDAENDDLAESPQETDDDDIIRAMGRMGDDDQDE